MHINSLKTLNRVVAASVMALAVLLAGCATTSPKAASARPEKEKAIVLSEGDTIKVAFPAAPNLDTVAQIRRDGKVTLPLVGEVQAAGLTAVELQNSLKEKYKDQLASDEINVVIVASNFNVYVTGAVRNPAKVASDRPLTALDAIMECGGPDYSRANLKGVIVDRKSADGRMQHFKLNLQDVLKGRSAESFYLRPGDILYVPEKFSWF